MRKLFYKILYSLKQFYWFIARPKTQGVKCIITYQGKILMMRRNYGKQMWVFPGGGIKAGEAVSEAVKREVKEDLGLVLNQLKDIGSFSANVGYRQETMYCFTSELLNVEAKIDTDRIANTQWFVPAELPKPLSPISQKVYDLWLRHSQKSN